MTLKDCCFSEVCQNMPKVDMTIGELIKLTGKEFVSKFGKELFEEVALVLSVYNLYFADCDEAMRKDIELYIGLICLKYTFSYALPFYMDKCQILQRGCLILLRQPQTCYISLPR